MDRFYSLNNEKLIVDCTGILCESGKLILLYRDYSNELNDQQRFIPVKSDLNRILTCILDYEPDKVKVTDLLHEKTENGWNQKVSSYRKVRITPKEIAEMIFNESIPECKQQLQKQGQTNTQQTPNKDQTNTIKTSINENIRYSQQNSEARTL
ncbi:MAG: hypothetical protein GY790_18830 [Bacteroidetes bacterium]|nr:hypothetical protein [Bacteroidota bacterium]